MIVSQLWIYPIKSCQGIKLQQAQVTPKGFLWDREFMLVNAKGKFLTQRQYPHLAKVKVQIADERVSLSVQDDSVEPLTFTSTLIGKAIEVEIWHDFITAIDQGDEVAQWFHSLLALDSHQKCRLVRQSPQHLRLIKHQFSFKNEEIVSFADSFPFLLTATASLSELNRRIGEIYQKEAQTVPMNQFRPNIVVETEQPFIEGNWRAIEIGTVQFTVVKPCSRCIIITTDQQTGERNQLREPLRTLETFRQFGDRGVMFGENMTPRNTGIVRVGEPLKILELRG
ncbi:MOSC N-terminal beta barrel domain-containing protein [Pleurocapsales cyanobacterium LEGE 06147]|nr:MOSC N-terminal beta barrel domain-containing protein [Pleurocapsales cyanobacterium LEGE 06147]